LQSCGLGEKGYSFTLCTAGNVQFSVVASITVYRHKSCTEILKKRVITNSFFVCHVFILEVGKIVKNVWILTWSKLEDLMTKQLIKFLVWNLGYE